MLVSVVMPVYNAGNYLNEAVQSLLKQSYSNWELIVVDDGSTDNSLEILNSYSDPRIRIFQRENGGQCAATNTALQHINGDYVLFFDADDVMDKDKIRRQLNTLRTEGNNVVAVGRWAFFWRTVEDAKFNDEPVYFSGAPNEWLYRLWAYETMMPNHGYLIPRQVLEKAGKYYDEEIFLNVDFEYFTRIVLAADKIIYCPDAICYYRKGVPGAKTTNPKLERRLSSLRSRAKAISYYLAKEKSERSIYASKMAITVLTYSYPQILPYSKITMKELGLGRFARFGGWKFRILSSVFGFSTAIKLKGLLKI
jgi:glycosyltransferase involved in cell wall biosynthesis